MLSNFLFSLNAVLPIFLIIFLGALLRKIAFLSEKTISEINNIVFTIALPLLLFRDVYRADFTGFFDVKLIVWALASTGLCFVLCWITAEVYLKGRPGLIGAFTQGSFRGNYAILGLPLIANLLGDANTGKGTMMVVFVVVTYNVLSVVVLSAKAAETVKKGFLKKTLFAVCRNPLIIGTVSGLLFSAFRITLPSALNTGVQYMAALCTPLALLAVGGAISFSESMKNIQPAVFAMLIKTVITPLVFTTVSIQLLGFSGEDLAVLFVMYAAPTAVSSYIMASKMESDATLASSILILTTVVSVFTFTVGIYTLKTCGLI